MKRPRRIQDVPIQLRVQYSKHWYRRSKSNASFNCRAIFKEGLPVVIDYRGCLLVFNIINDSGVRQQAIVNPLRTPGQEWMVITSNKLLAISAELVAAWHSTNQMLR